MAKFSKEEKEKIKESLTRRLDILKEIKVLMKINPKSHKEYKELIKLSKEISTHIGILKNYGYVEWTTNDINPKYWEDEYKKFLGTDILKPKATKQVESNTNLYYIMLCWTAKTDYCVCDNIVNNVKSYLEKMGLEYFCTDINAFPDRIEHCHTFKLRSIEEVYNTILKSAEHIIEISSGSTYDKCNVGIFGKFIDVC